MIDELGELLKRIPPNAPIYLLDCCCGAARLAKFIRDSGVGISRVCYQGIDADRDAVSKARADKTSGDFDGFQEFDVRQRELSDLSGYELGSYHLITINNAIHEIKASQLPDLICSLYELLAPEFGRLCIIDLEELPETTLEPWAITYESREMQHLIESSGCRADCHVHFKDVVTFRLVLDHCEIRPSKMRMREELLGLLVKKRNKLLDSLPAWPFESGTDCFQLVRAVFRIVALQREVRELEKVCKKKDAKSETNQI